ncbi:hypothetical protein ACVBEH_28640, partial [Roseateles sp. GG27B]
MLSAGRSSGQTGGLGTVDAQLMALLRRLAQPPADSGTVATWLAPNGFLMLGTLGEDEEAAPRA